MKLICVFMFAALLQVSAASYSQTTKLKLTGKSLSLEKVFELIEDQSEFSFIYNLKQVDLDKQVDVNFKNKRVEKILDDVLAGTNITYTVDDRLIVIHKKGESTFVTKSLGEQQKKVSGKVTDSSGMPLPGVTVVLKGTTQGAITDVDGKYTLPNISEDAVLQFSFVGMKIQEIPVAGKSTINVEMREETIGLEEVVAIGYGTMKKSDLTGAVASIKSDELDAYPTANVAQALQGKIAGVTVTPADGRPDASVAYKIRGGGSITQDNNPLFIVDGFPVTSINDIPASQIESINVLKDASSTAIYGARGANGVILITTKKPKGDGKISVSYDANIQIKKPASYLEVLGVKDFLYLNWEYATLFGYGDAYEMAYGLGTKYSYLNKEGIDSYKESDFRNIQKEILGTVCSQSHSITISGGNKKTKYSISYSYLDDPGTKIQSWYKRTSIMGKLQQELTKGLILNLDLHIGDNTVFGNEDKSATTGSLLTTAMRFTPVTPLGDISSNNSQLGMYNLYVDEEYDPVSKINDIYDKTHRQYVRANAALTWNIVDGLTFRTEYGAKKGYTTQYYYEGAVAKETTGVEGADASIEKGYITSYRLVNTLKYIVKGLGDNHKVDIMAGQEITGNTEENSSLSGTNYPLSYNRKQVFAMMNQYGTQNEVSISNTIEEPERLSSFFGRVNYSFKGKYLFSGTFRVDGSSKFSEDNRWGYFPAAAIAWRMSEEPFIKDISCINNLKLRLSYGVAGNDNIESGLWKMQWQAESGGYSYSDVGNAYYSAASDMMTNEDLKWETTITRNFGIDYSLFKNRIYGTVDAYWNSTKDLLMVNQIPAYTGYSERMENIGETRNIGFELSVGGDIVRQKDLKISAQLNFSLNRNKVVKLSDDMEYYNYSSGWGGTQTVPFDGDYTLIKGQPVGLIRGFVYDGFYTTDDFNYDSSSKTYTLKDGEPDPRAVIGTVPGVGSSAYPGMLKLKKLNTENSETSINSTDDATIIGNTNPKHVGGLNINVAYKNFDLLMAFNWSYGNDIYNATTISGSSGDKRPIRNFSNYVENWYHLFDIDEDGNLSRVYKPAKLDALNENAQKFYPYQEYKTVHSGAIEDGSFLRLNNLTLGYTLPSRLVNKVSIQRVRVYATIYNAWLWTNYSGCDPEVDSDRDANDYYPTPGMDFGAYPKSRTYTFGINVNF